MSADDVYCLLKLIEPEFYNAEVGYARRWATAQKYKGKRKPFEKKGSASGGQLGEGVVVDHRTDGAKKMWENFAFTGSGTATPPLRKEQATDPNWRPMSRDPIRAIKPFLKKFADDHQFPGGRDMRFYDTDVYREDGIEFTDVDHLTCAKRLCISVSQFFWPLYRPRHWMKD
ncbi:MAG: hypothetical protein ABJN14_08490 [Paracoccaceae bacterium]